MGCDLNDVTLGNSAIFSDVGISYMRVNRMY
jgi:hypothetical protein